MHVGGPDGRLNRSDQPHQKPPETNALHGAALHYLSLDNLDRDGPQLASAGFIHLDRYCQKDQAAGPNDGIPLSMCRVCGFPGPHHSPRDCIGALRDRIADLEFKAKGAGGRKRDSSSLSRLDAI